MRIGLISHNYGINSQHNRDSENEGGVLRQFNMRLNVVMNKLYLSGLMSKNFLSVQVKELRE